MGLFTGMGKMMADGMMDDLLERMLKDNYLENIFGMYNTVAKVGPLHLVENMMRAVHGQIPDRPMGSPLPLSPWDKLLFNPVSLTRLPTADAQEIDTKTRIGPEAAKPLELKIPLLVGAMSYGTALSAKAKVALAKGTSQVGTATNTGESYLPAEREAADKLVVQYHRGTWPQNAEKAEFLQTADMIEIQLSQGAQGAAYVLTPPSQVDEEMRKTFGLDQGMGTFTSSRLEGVSTPEDLRRLVESLKTAYPVPVGVKFAASHYLEAEMDIFLGAGVDFLVVDGAEGGTHGGPPILQDDLGLPTLHAVARASRHLEENGLKEKVSLLAAGGLHSPGYYLKAMALGADAVYLGTVAIIALVAAQVNKVTPWEPPFSLAFNVSHRQGMLDMDLAAASLANMLRASVAEMDLAARAMGKTALAQVGISDLVALDPYVAKISGAALATAPEEKTFVLPPPEADGLRSNLH